MKQPLLLALVLLACTSPSPPRAQWLVAIATDAPVPELGQQLLIELIDADGRDLSPLSSALFDASSAALWPRSFGVVPSASAKPPRVRARLYRLDQTGADGTPIGLALLDATGTLPPLAATEGPIQVALTLAMKCFGVPSDPVAHRTCDAATGSLAAEPTLAPVSGTAPLPSPGSWSPGKVMPCAGAAPTGMECIPGGVFLLGSAVDGLSLPPETPTPEHLVELHPFAIDRDEFTVGAYRELVLSKGLLPPVVGDTGGESPPECTYLGGNVATNDALPVNCVTWQQASDACSAAHKRLPTEAEWEYVAGNLGVKTPFPWGSDTTICEYAVVARGRAFAGSNEGTECLMAPNFTPGPVAGGDPLDITTLGVRNLGGNVSEWVSGAFASYSAPCWNTSTLLVDPSCAATGAGAPLRTARGGSWQSLEDAAYASQRGLPASGAADVAVGFRCATDL